MSEWVERVEITQEEAVALLPLVVGEDYQPSHGADLQLLLNDGRRLEYWTESDSGPSYWWLYAAVMSD